MAVLRVDFVAGRYHATPWGRHVNEAAVAWPPEPWRLLRALVATWHRKADRERFPEPVLEELVAVLSSRLPRYRLPPAAHAHLQHYMPIPKGSGTTTTLVFDGFLQIEQGAPLVAWWPEVELTREPRELFEHLVVRLGYLGRAESWVEARPSWEPPPEGFDTVPWSEIDPAAAGEHEIVDLLAPVPSAEYPVWREGALAAARQLRGRMRQRAEATLPERFLDALRLETRDVQDAKWSRFPGTRLVAYGRPVDWDRRVRRRAKIRTASRRRTTVRLALTGRPLPRIEDAVRVAEAMRKALLKTYGERGGVPPVVSGRDDGGRRRAAGHEHLYYLPEDADGDGWIDHLLLHAHGGLDEVLPQIEHLDRLWLDADSTTWRLLFELAGPAEDIAHVSPLLARSDGSRRWRSLTPYLHPWHAKRGFGPDEQIARELAGRTFGGRRVELASAPRPLREIEVGGALRRPLHFHRFRTRRGLVQPDRTGGFWELELSEPIVGPLALGFASHFGLGLFTPAT